jgi:thioredoxin-like negative regulator of GroEL
LADEARALEAAEKALRSGDLQQTLVQLDEYEHEFPKGSLLAEALAVRARALLAAGRDEEAVSTLEALGDDVPPALAQEWGAALWRLGRCADAARFPTVKGFCVP